MCVSFSVAVWTYVTLMGADHDQSPAVDAAKRT